jgi:hypothetical protein
VKILFCITSPLRKGQVNKALVPAEGSTEECSLSGAFKIGGGGITIEKLRKNIDY